MSTPPQPLCVADDRTFWPWLTWADFALRRNEAGATTVLVPLVGLCDWGLGHAYDAEEQLLMPVLAEALKRRPAEPRLLLLPPLRFVLGVAGSSVCSVDPALAHAFIDETLASIAVAGFTRIVLVNASPWNEELVDAAARDIRIARGLQMFCVNLSALKLDLHPTRSRTRRRAQTLLTHLTGRMPEVPASGSAPVAALQQDESIRPLDGTPATLAEAQREGPLLLAEAAAHLASLLGEICARPALPNAGALTVRTYP